METHDPDPKTESPGDPWETASDDFAELRRQLKETYRKVAQDMGPTDEAIREAFSTLAGAWDQVSESLSIALKDPEIREQLKEAASSFATALGTTLSEFGSELKRVQREEDDSQHQDAR